MERGCHARLSGIPDVLFPAHRAEIDWTRGYDFLDQELAQVVRDAELGRRLLDKLVRVATRDGDEQWVYVHIEIQGQRDADFAERLFVYNYRLYDRYRRPIATLAVLADASPSWKSRGFRYRRFGCHMAIRFPLAKLMDHRDRLDELLGDDNPFALVTAAHLLTQQTRGDNDARLAAKWRLARLLCERDWERIIDLFAILDWMMALPDALQSDLWHRLSQLERTRHVPYITSVERIGIEKGIQQCIGQGQARLLRLQIEQRFGALGAEAAERLQQAAPAELERWGIRLLTAATLEEVFEPDERH